MAGGRGSRKGGAEDFQPLYCRAWAVADCTASAERTGAKPHRLPADCRQSHTRRPVPLGQQGGGRHSGTHGILGAYGELQRHEEVLQEQEAYQELAGKMAGDSRHPPCHYRTGTMGQGTGIAEEQAPPHKDGQA